MATLDWAARQVKFPDNAPGSEQVSSRGSAGGERGYCVVPMNSMVAMIRSSTALFRV